MSEEIPVIVKAGTRFYYGDGPYLEVTDFVAVGMNGRLYQTQFWADRTAASKAAWDNRPRWRKWLNLPPKGYEPVGAPVQPLFGIFGSLF